MIPVLVSLANDWPIILLAALIATLAVLIIFKPWPNEVTEDGLTEREWDAQYDEAMQWRDWETCDYLIEQRAQATWYVPESLPAPHRAGERGPVAVSQSSSLEQLTAETTAGATVFDWDAA